MLQTELTRLLQTRQPIIQAPKLLAYRGEKEMAVKALEALAEQDV